MTTPHGASWIRHTESYLAGVDPNLVLVFREAMRRAGFPEQSAALALEGICADFLAGNKHWARIGREHAAYLMRQKTPQPTTEATAEQQAEYVRAVTELEELHRAMPPMGPIKDYKVLTDEKIAEQETPDA